MNTCCENVNVKRLSIAAVAVFVADYVLGWLIHGVLLKPTYLSQPFWRNEADMARPDLFFAMLVGHVVFAAAFTWIYQFGCKGERWEGLRYGFYAWCLAAVPAMLMTYAMLPVGVLVPFWLVLSLPRFLILGLLVGAIYKPKER